MPRPRLHRAATARREKVQLRIREQSFPDDAPASDAPAQGHDDDSARPLSLPQLNLLASLRVQ